MSRKTRPRPQEHPVTTPFDDGATVEGHAPSAEEVAARETLTWEGFGGAARDLAHAIVGSGWMPDLIIAIARGGLLPAGALSYAMGVKAIGTMNVEFYTGVGETLPEPQLLPPLMDVSAIDGHRVLVVDDVADSGRTLAMIMDLMGEHGLSLDGQGAVAVDARSAVIYRKPRSVIVPDYEWRITDRWINFPWSTKPVIRPGD
jgi:hypoxanthine phosphoribosyltransferase